MGLFSKKPSLADDTVKKYYEIIYGLRSSTTWGGKESAESNSCARRYVEFILGGPCDEAKLKDAVELINMSFTEYPKTKLENQLKEYNKELKGLKKYTCDRFTVYKVCFPNLLEEVKLKYANVLDVVKDYNDVNHFCYGIDKQLSESEPWKNNLMRDCFFMAMRDSLLEGNPITIKNLCALFIDVLDNRKKKRVEYDIPFVNVAYSFAMHALQFEKYGKKCDEYVALSLEECQELVLRSPVFIAAVEKHPFEKEKYVKQYAEGIQKTHAFGMYFSSYYKKHFFFDKCFWEDNCFDDALCYYAWREIAKEYVGTTNENGEDISESRDPIEIVNMTYDYLNNL